MAIRPPWTIFLSRAILPAVNSTARGVLLVAVAAGLVCGAPACGGEDSAPPVREQPQHLTGAERAAARSGHGAIRAYCARLGLYLAGRRARPGPATQQRAVEGARTIARLARAKPQAPYSRAQTARQLAGDTAEDLEGTNCSARLVLELRRGLRTG
jgi:hypothetical protein